jgi:hypothetical protein
MDLLKAALNICVASTPVAPFAGVVATTTGLVAVVKLHT